VGRHLQAAEQLEDGGDAEQLHRQGVRPQSAHHHRVHEAYGDVRKLRRHHWPGQAERGA